jgi:sortase (surface protein transpeptidase)
MELILGDPSLIISIVGCIAAIVISILTKSFTPMVKWLRNRALTKAQEKKEQERVKIIGEAEDKLKKTENKFNEYMFALNEALNIFQNLKTKEVENGAGTCESVTEQSVGTTTNT